MLHQLHQLHHLCTRLKLWRFTLWASAMWVLWQMCKTYGLQWPRWNWEVGKKSFTETRCYFSVGGNVNPEKPYEVFKFLPASICSTCVLFFCVRSIFGKDLWLWNEVSEGCPPKRSLQKRGVKYWWHHLLETLLPSTQHPIKTQLTAGAGCQHAGANSEGLSLGTEALRQNCNQQTVKLVGKDN